MRCLTIVALFLTAAVTCCGPGPAVTAEPTETRTPLAATPEAPTLTPTCGPGPSVTAEPTETHIPLITATPEAPTLTPTAVEPMTPTATPSQEPTAEGPLLRMVIIRARSSLEVRQLRQMNLDIVRVRPDPSRPPNEELLFSGGFIVEAVVTRGVLAKLKAMGFEVSEVPPPEK